MIDDKRRTKLRLLLLIPTTAMRGCSMLVGVDLRGDGAGEDSLHCAARAPKGQTAIRGVAELLSSEAGTGRLLLWRTFRGHQKVAFLETSW
jgi:hypothetical protein